MKKQTIHQSLLSILALLAILALFTFPAGAAPEQPATTRPQRNAAIRSALGWLHTQQQTGGDRDGSIGGLGESCDIARAVAQAGDDPDGPSWTPSSISLLQRCRLDLPDYLVREDAGRIAKALRAAVAAGENPRDFAGYDLIALLEAQYDPQIGFYHPTNLFRNDLAIIALTEAGRPIPQKAIDAVVADQNPDGCWGWPIGGDVTDTDTSGLTIHALSNAGSPDLPAVSQCIARLMTMQNDDGGWELSGVYDDKVSNVDSTALVIQGLVAAGWDPDGPALTRDQSATQALLSFQGQDGSFWWRHDQRGTPLLGTKQTIQPLMMTYPNEIPKPIPLYLPISLR